VPPLAPIGQDPPALPVGGADPFALAAAAAEVLGRRSGRPVHDAAVVLGSGLAGTSAALGAPRARIPFAEIPGLPPSRAPGHRAECWSMELEGKGVLVFLGRLHLYEGRTPGEVCHAVRTAAAAGCTDLVLTNASGAIDARFAPGSIVALGDHINLTGQSPLTGLVPPAAGPGSAPGDARRGPFVDLTDCWSPGRRARLRERGIPEGVYAQLPGPQFETPAEIRMLRAMGADLVGMSTALEAIAARHLGMTVTGLSVVTNLAAGIPRPGSSEVSPVTVHDIGTVATQAVGRLAELIRTVLPDG
jgi:purine-nucleoside phosphorylase